MKVYEEGETIKMTASQIEGLRLEAVRRDNLRNAELSGSQKTPGFLIKDSGARQQFESGMVRDTQGGKRDYTLIRGGPMFNRWAEHLTKGAIKYGRGNWLKANGQEEFDRFKISAARHFEQWLAGETDEDHAAAVIFNINGVEYVKERMAE